MRMRALATLLALSATAPSVHAADWFDQVSLQLGTIEQVSPQQIIMWVNNGGAPVNAVGRSSTCAMTSVLLSASTASQGRDWLAMILAATMSGHAITVYGHCNTSTQQIEATRLQVVYQGP